MFKIILIIFAFIGFIIISLELLLEEKSKEAKIIGIICLITSILIITLAIYALIDYTKTPDIEYNKPNIEIKYYEHSKYRIEEDDIYVYGYEKDIVYEMYIEREYTVDGYEFNLVYVSAYVEKDLIGKNYIEEIIYTSESNDVKEFLEYILIEIDIECIKELLGD